MNIKKEASVCAVGTPDAQALAKINLYSKSPLSAEQVYCFSVRLCDDQPDRDFERFDTAALSVLAELFLGKTGIADHDWSSDRQVARVFDTQVAEQDGIHFLQAQCYLLRTQKNEDLIAEIEGGIKKEVSIGCAVGQSTCSICGKSYGSCEHRKGVLYGDQVCIAVLSAPTDAYEFSFVAVPAQKHAGVLKAMRGGESMTLQELVSKNGSPELLSRLKALELDAAFGKACRENIVDEVVSLAVLLDFGASEDVLKKSFASLSFHELCKLKQGMNEKSAQLFPSSTQLPSASASRCPMDNDYMI
ncbi:MAG: hypothetical protein E7434_06095 [Ruminococcaceae bacterium]|nr:hypothetical protein [Oscillospiraceae bacterium]